jgi:hypothetical protein
MQRAQRRPTPPSGLTFVLGVRRLLKENVLGRDAVAPRPHIRLGFGRGTACPLCCDAVSACQSARKRDPVSACKKDPQGAACAGSP